MISPKKKHVEKQKLSDKFQQPWDNAGTNGHTFVQIFNSRNQKKRSKRKK